MSDAKHLHIVKVFLKFSTCILYLFLKGFFIFSYLLVFMNIHYVKISFYIFTTWLSFLLNFHSASEIHKFMITLFHYICLCWDHMLFVCHILLWMNLIKQLKISIVLISFLISWRNDSVTMNSVGNLYLAYKCVPSKKKKEYPIFWILLFIKFLIYFFHQLIIKCLQHAIYTLWSPMSVPISGYGNLLGEEFLGLGCFYPTWALFHVKLYFIVAHPPRQYIPFIIFFWRLLHSLLQ